MFTSSCNLSNIASLLTSVVTPNGACPSYSILSPMTCEGARGAAPAAPIDGAAGVGSGEMVDKVGASETALDFGTGG